MRHVIPPCLSLALSSVCSSAGLKDVTNKRTLMHAFAEWCQRSHKDLLAVIDDFPDMEEVCGLR